MPAREGSLDVPSPESSARPCQQLQSAPFLSVRFYSVWLQQWRLSYCSRVVLFLARCHQKLCCQAGSCTSCIIPRVPSCQHAVPSCTLRSCALHASRGRSSSLAPVLPTCATLPCTLQCRFFRWFTAPCLTAHSSSASPRPTQSHCCPATPRWQKVPPWTAFLALRDSSMQTSITTLRCPSWRLTHW